MQTEDENQVEVGSCSIDGEGDDQTSLACLISQWGSSKLMHTITTLRVR